MAIRLKVAKTPEEIDGALWVRHEVFIVEDGKFGGSPTADERMMDRFDALPDTCNVIAYDGEEPIATMRLIRENEVGLPVDDYFDFSTYREQVRNEFPQSSDCGGESGSKINTVPIFGSAGMLAVREAWRNRRDVIRAMYRIAAGVYRSWDVTHVVAIVNHRTATMYRRMGFAPLTEKIWRDDIGDHIVPLAATMETCCKWAFGDLPETPLGAFKNGFERFFVRTGDTIFREGDDGQHAYIVGSGSVRIAVKSHDNSELTLAKLGRGDLFGEFALIDAMPRSATAVATSNAELITLDREVFQREVVNHPERILQLLEIFTARIRRMDGLMSTLAPTGQSKRLEFALGLERIQTIRDSSSQGEQTIDDDERSDLEYADMVPDLTARQVFDNASRDDEITYAKGQIRFIR